MESRSIKRIAQLIYPTASHFVVFILERNGNGYVCTMPEVSDIEQLHPTASVEAINLSQMRQQAKSVHVRRSLSV